MAVHNPAYSQGGRENARPLTDLEREQIIRRLTALARLLDARFLIPGTNFRFGLDGLIGLIPGIGDTATNLVSLYILYEARRLGASRATLVRMAANIGIDWLVGLVPLAGDLFDVAFKANIRNLRLMGIDPLAPEPRGGGATPRRRV